MVPKVLNLVPFSLYTYVGYSKLQTSSAAAAAREMLEVQFLNRSKHMCNGEQAAGQQDFRPKFAVFFVVIFDK